MNGRAVDGQTVRVQLAFPETGIQYTVRVKPEGEAIHLWIDLNQPLPDDYVGKVGFNLELLPSAFSGKAFQMDGSFGTFPRQANGPVISHPSGDCSAAPLAEGSRLTAAPEDPYRRIDIYSLSGKMALLDGRSSASNNWFIVREEVRAGAAQGAVEWVITPNRVKGWFRPPVLLISQVGYHPNQEKQALIELDPSTSDLGEVTLSQITAEGLQTIRSAKPQFAGRFLHYQYASFDFSAVRQAGMYVLSYAGQITPPFKISEDVYQEGIWQPTLETFMPVQMCHMRVVDGHRVWHGACHLDDAIQAPTDHKHFDGYVQYGETETNYHPYEHIPGLDRGGWHDAGDYDLAAGSQASTTYDFALIYEAFKDHSDQTTVRRDQRLVLLHQPDGVPDLVHQVIHGVECLLGGYHAAGHSFTGIIEGELSQYVHLGDAATMTDNLAYDPHASPEGEPGKRDDRWAFTNHDTALEYQVAAALAASARVIGDYDRALSQECLDVALKIWEEEHSHPPVLQPNAYQPRDPQATEFGAAVELLLTSGQERFEKQVLSLWTIVEKRFEWLGWQGARILSKVTDETFKAQVRSGAEQYKARLEKEESESPFRLPFGEGWLKANRPGFDPFAADYQPPIWGVGWSLQRFAVHYYYLVQAFPDLFDRESLLRVLNYVLGWHPANNLSLVSGVGAQSLTIAYGTNRAEWSYIPGGVASGPALVRPDIIELMDPWPWLWQQKEYVISGATSYIFLVMAADRLLNGAQAQ